MSEEYIYITYNRYKIFEKFHGRCGFLPSISSSQLANNTNLVGKLHKPQNQEKSNKANDVG